MALVVKGRVVPMASDQSVAADVLSSFRGRVWISDDGLVAAVTKGSAKGPAALQGAPVVDVGSSLVFPGLIDLHNHLAYNTLPCWTEPGRTKPFPHHNSWPSAKSYAPSITWPTYAFITAAPAELLAYVEAKAIVGGTTSIQGSPPKNRPRDGWMVRNVEDERFDGGPDLVYASALTMKPDALADRARKMHDGATFIYHCAEGQLGSRVADEFSQAENAGCLQQHFVAIHCSAVAASAFRPWAPPGSIVWSPFSNLWLYGMTTDVPGALKAGINVCLGSDWRPSGTKHVLGELKVARLVADHFGWDLGDNDLVKMVTCHPGDALALTWPHQVGRLQPGAIADLAVIAAPTATADPFKTLVNAVERDVQLVVIMGRARYGTTKLMSAARATPTVAFDVGGESRTLALSHPEDQAAAWDWQAVIDRLEAVRVDPKSEIDRARQAFAAWAGRLDARQAPLRLALDMPTGVAPVGGLPKDLGQITIPPLDSLTHDAAFLSSVVGHGFHGGVLDGLTGYYS